MAGDGIADVVGHQVIVLRTGLNVVWITREVQLAEKYNYCGDLVSFEESLLYKLRNFRTGRVSVWEERMVLCGYSTI